MLPKIIRRASFIFKRDPCLNCLVQSCCLKKCDLSDHWKYRFDLIKLPFQICYYSFMIIVVSLILTIFMVLLIILQAAGYKEVCKMLGKEGLRY